MNPSTFSDASVRDYIMRKYGSSRTTPDAACVKEEKDIDDLLATTRPSAVDLSVRGMILAQVLTDFVFQSSYTFSTRLPPFIKT